MVAFVAGRSPARLRSLPESEEKLSTNYIDDVATNVRSHAVRKCCEKPYRSPHRTTGERSSQPRHDSSCGRAGPATSRGRSTTRTATRPRGRRKRSPTAGDRLSAMAPGSPLVESGFSQKGYRERIDARRRKERPNGSIFDSRTKARIVSRGRRRPHDTSPAIVPRMASDHSSRSAVAGRGVSVSAADLPAPSSLSRPEQRRPRADRHRACRARRRRGCAPLRR